MAMFRRGLEYFRWRHSTVDDGDGRNAQRSRAVLKNNHSFAWVLEPVLDSVLSITARDLATQNFICDDGELQTRIATLLRKLMIAEPPGAMRAVAHFTRGPPPSAGGGGGRADDVTLSALTVDTSREWVPLGALDGVSMVQTDKVANGAVQTTQVFTLREFYDPRQFEESVRRLLLLLVENRGDDRTVLRAFSEEMPELSAFMRRTFLFNATNTRVYARHAAGSGGGGGGERGGGGGSGGVAGGRGAFVSHRRASLSSAVAAALSRDSSTHSPSASPPASPAVGARPTPPPPPRNVVMHDGDKELHTATASEAAADGAELAAVVGVDILLPYDHASMKQNYPKFLDAIEFFECTVSLVDASRSKTLLVFELSRQRLQLRLNLHGRDLVWSHLDANGHALRPLARRNGQPDVASVDLMNPRGVCFLVIAPIIRLPLKARLHLPVIDLELRGGAAADAATAAAAAAAEDAQPSATVFGRIARTESRLIGKAIQALVPGLHGTLQHVVETYRARWEVRRREEGAAADGGGDFVFQQTTVWQVPVMHRVMRKTYVRVVNDKMRDVEEMNASDSAVDPRRAYLRAITADLRAMKNAMNAARAPPPAPPLNLRPALQHDNASQNAAVALR